MDGFTTAVFCLAGGIMSLTGGGLMSFEIRLPFYIAAMVATLGLLEQVGNAAADGAAR